MKEYASPRGLVGAALYAIMAGMLVAGVACTSGPNPQVQKELEGTVQAIDDKEAVITLDDGTRVRVEIEKSADDVKKMVGEDVVAVVESSDDKGKPKLVEVKKAAEGAVTPEDFHFSGAVESMGPEQWVIGGKTFKVNAATMLDQGLAVGVIADIEFIKMSDGSLLATEIETMADDNVVGPAGKVMEAGEDFSFTGVLQSMTADTIVVAGKTFKKDAATVVDNGVAAGVLVRVEFIVKPDGSFLALEIETDAPDSVLESQDMRATGPIEAMTADSVKIDGRTFKIVPSTARDSGLGVGVLAKVEFTPQPDGSLVAKEIETIEYDEGVNLYFSGVIQSVSPGVYVVGGNTFKTTPLTKIDTGLVVGAVADVQFTIQPDGSMVAVEVETGGFEFIGMLQSVAPGAYVIGGRTFAVEATTVIDRGLKPKKLVKVKFIFQPDGSLLARVITAANTKLLGFSLKGVVQTMGPTSLVVSTRTFGVGPATVIGAGVAVNKQVIVRFDMAPGGTMVALNVQLAAAAKKK